MALDKVAQQRTALLQILLLVLMVFFAVVTYLTMAKTHSAIVPFLMVISLAICLYVLIKERRLRRLQDQLVAEIVQGRRVISEKDQEIDHLDRELATLRDQAHADRLSSVSAVVLGLADEMAPQLSTAQSAAEAVKTTARQLAEGETAQVTELVDDLDRAASLIEKGVGEALVLVKSLRNQSSRQLSDDKMVVDLREVVDDCVRAMNAETKRNGIGVEVRCDDAQLPWHGYPGRLSQVFVSLIRNAAQHAYPNGGGRLEIHATRVAEDGQTVYRIAFKDAGCGIPGDRLPSIFSPASTERGKAQSGFGLPVAHNIVTEALKSKIECTSEPDQGTTVTLLLGTEVPDERDV